MSSLTLAAMAIRFRRVAKSGVKGSHLREAQAINKSLSALGDVIASLQQKSSHVPYVKKHTHCLFLLLLSLTL